MKKTILNYLLDSAIDLVILLLQERNGKVIKGYKITATRPNVKDVITFSKE